MTMNQRRLAVGLCAFTALFAGAPASAQEADTSLQSSRMTATSHGRAVTVQGSLLGCWTSASGERSCADAAPPQADARKALLVHSDGFIRLQMASAAAAVTAEYHDRNGNRVGPALKVDVVRDPKRWRIRIGPHVPRAARSIRVRAEAAAPEGAIRLWQVALRRHVHRA